MVDVILGFVAIALIFGVLACFYKHDYILINILFLGFAFIFIIIATTTSVLYWNQSISGSQNITGDLYMCPNGKLWVNDVYGCSDINFWSTINMNWNNITRTNLTNVKIYNSNLTDVFGFPRPDYDSGWISIAQNQLLEFTHNLGGNASTDYYFDVIAEDDVVGINKIAYGTRVVGSNYQGYYIRNVSSTILQVYRPAEDTVCEKVRVMIWKISGGGTTTTSPESVSLDNDPISHVGDIIFPHNVTIEGNLTVDGNLTGNFIYAEMWNYTVNTSTWSFQIANDNVYYNLTNLQKGNCNGFLYTDETQANGGSYLNTTIAGLYKVDFSISYSADGKGLYGVGVAKNFEINLNRDCYTRRQISTGVDVGNVGVSCLLDLVLGDIINVQMEDEENPTKDINIHAVNLNLIRVGD